VIKLFLLPEDYNKVGNYSIINEYTGEVYAGSGILKDCYDRHRTGYNNDNHDNIKLREAFKRTPYGWEFHAIVVNETNLSATENREIAFNLEQETINECYGDTNFLNISIDARKCRHIGHKDTLETIDKKRKSRHNYIKNISSEDRNKWISNLSKAKKGIVFSEEHKNKLSEVRLELFTNGYISPLKGIPLSEEHNRTLQNSRNNWWNNLTDEEKTKHTAKMLLTLKGNSNTLGRKQSQEEINKRIFSTTGKTRTDEQKNNIRNGIKNSNNIKFIANNIEFSSYTDAAILFNISVQTVINRVNSTSDKFKDWFRS